MNEDELKGDHAYRPTVIKLMTYTLYVSVAGVVVSVIAIIL